MVLEDVMALTMPGARNFHLCLDLVEIAQSVLIVGYAWRWPKQAAA
ncbi:hypothetical protein N789_10920 [Arenimonas oryziterrae DSM 21050 = YC6267]|uniref:Uncharacterized protein n=2 Tax=Arenimonas TaxID=490567 RepID=A0A091AUH7_9GAMM|nr:hypothetical protein N789_10920 [Arenimonas oryziterrae DSM 21050 = YC6267]